MEMEAYRKVFPGMMIQKLVDCGYIARVEYCGRDMADPYRVSVKARNTNGIRLIFQEFP